MADKAFELIGHAALRQIWRIRESENLTHQKDIAQITASIYRVNIRRLV